MFDINACHNGAEFWIETKIDNTSGVEPQVTIRSTQYAWSHMRHKAGGKLFLMAYRPVKKSIVIYTPPFVVVPTKTDGVLKLHCAPTDMGPDQDYYWFHLKNFFTKK
jgi:hypothetical protein